MAREVDENDLFDNLKSEIGKIRSRPERNPFSTVVDHLYRVGGPRTAETLQRRKGKSVRIALVSMPEFVYDIREFSLKGTKLPPGVDPDACKRRLVSFGRRESNRMVRVFKEALSKALEDHKADIVCVSELGLPSRQMEPVPSAIKFAHQMSKRHNALIIAGSAHDARTHYNTAYVFHPGSSKDGLTAHKSISAVSTDERKDERISMPALRRILRLHIFGLGIATMICLDMADYAAVAKIVKVGDAIDMVFVPCYTDKFDKLAEIATTASKALPGMFALVNAKLSHGAAPCCHVAVFGKREEPRTKPLRSGAVISLLDVKYDDFQATRTQMKTSSHSQMEWLFGSRDRPEVYENPT